MASGFKLDTWMADLANSINDKAINNILLPGTHDSGSYQNFDFTILQTTTDTIFTYLNMVIGLPCVQTSINNWSICQTMSIYTQLMNGIRTLDMRVSFDITTNVFYITHTYFSEQLSVVISDLNSFLSTHPTEIVFVQITPDYEYTADWTNLMEFNMCQLFINTLLNYVIPYNGTIPTYAQAVASKKNLVLLYSNYTIDPTHFWNISLFSATWFDYDDPDTQITNFTAYLQAMKPPSGNFNGLLFTVTPDSDTIVQNVFNPTTLQTITGNLLVLFDSFMTNNLINFSKLSYIAMDFPTQAIIQKIIEYNQS